MKKLLIFLTAIFVCTLFESCSKEDYTSPLKDVVLKDVTLEASVASYSSIDLETDDMSKISVSSSEAWCRPYFIGTGLIVTAEANTTYEERSAIVTILDSEDGTTKTFVVTQKQNTAILVDKEVYEIGEEGGEIDIEVASNVSYQVEINDDWVKQISSNTRGLESSTITLNVLRNTSGDERQTIIKLFNSTTGETANVTIKQEFRPYFNIHQRELLFDEGESEVEVNVTTNMDIEVTIDNNWIDVTQKYPLDDVNMVYVFKTQPLPETLNRRRGTIYFRNTRWDIAEAIEVLQTRSLYIEESDIELNEGDSYTLNLVKNIPGGVYWESSDTYVATVDYDGNVTGLHEGSAIITVYSGDYKYYDRVVVNVVRFNILDNLSSDFDFGWTSIVSDQGALSGYFVSCTLKNNSNKDIKLLSCKVVKDNTIIDVFNCNYDLEAKSSVTYTSYLSSIYGIGGSYTFVFDFTLFDVLYTYQCVSPTYSIN